MTSYFVFYDIISHKFLPIQPNFQTQFIDCLRLRQEKRDIQDEECTRLSRTFRKKLSHYEREGTTAISKVQIMEPQLERIESDLTKAQAEVRKLEKKNRALMETQRVYELDRKELQGN